MNARNKYINLLCLFIIKEKYAIPKAKQNVLILIDTFYRHVFIQ